MSQPVPEQQKKSINPILRLKKNPSVLTGPNGQPYFHSDMTGTHLSKRTGIPIFDKEKNKVLALYGAFADNNEVGRWLKANLDNGGFTTEQHAEYLKDLQKFVSAGSPLPEGVFLSAADAYKAKQEAAKQPRPMHYLIFQDQDEQTVQYPADADFAAAGFIAAVTSGCEDIGKYVLVCDPVNEQSIVTELPMEEKDLVAFSRAFKRDINTLRSKEVDSSVRIICKDSYARMLAAREAKRAKQAEARASKVGREQGKKRQEIIRPVARNQEQPSI